jgi:23S rRNA (cytosine1962-C5)-methyltransferase
MLKKVYLKKNEERRVKSGHPWIFSNEIDTDQSPLQTFSPGEAVTVLSAKDEVLGSGYLNPHTLLSVRLYSSKANIPFDADLIKTRLENALALRNHYFTAPYYRLCFGEGDLLPGIIIDRFKDILVVQLTTQGAWLVREILISVLIDLLKPQGIFLKNDQQNLALEGLTPATEILYGQVPESLLIFENDIPFHVPLQHGQKTGWFYDQRNNRTRLAPLVKNKTVLDVFAYLGSFGIYAGVYGAKSIHFIESSKFACDYIQKNLQENNLTDKAEIIAEDAFDALKNLKSQGQQFDVVLVDPPAFIKRKKDMDQGFLAYQRINELALACVKGQGMLVSSSCSMHLSAADLQKALLKANKQRAVLKVLDLAYQAPDHPWHLAILETLYLKTFFLQKCNNK